jgi:hypothetical protein
VQRVSGYADNLSDLVWTLSPLYEVADLLHSFWRKLYWSSATQRLRFQLNGLGHFLLPPCLRAGAHLLRSIGMAGSASAILSGTERLNSASRAADKATLIFLAAHTIGIVDRGIIEPDRRLTKRCNKAAIRVVTAM